MAVDQGWFPDWYAGGWFPSVWFAPADESHLVAEEIRPGGKRRPRVTRMPQWVHAPLPIPADPPPPPDDEDALLLCGMI